MVFSQIVERDEQAIVLDGHHGARGPRLSLDVGSDGASRGKG